ncbi:MAG TPA: hypothetical protein VN222_16045 [Novosphingobium sp.]|nr:hypothetical protein [Novosphingobium sp.]
MTDDPKTRPRGVAFLRGGAAGPAASRRRGVMTLALVALAVLAFLVAIDRMEGLHVRPATGTSISLWSGHGG